MMYEVELRDPPATQTLNTIFAWRLTWMPRSRY